MTWMVGCALVAGLLFGPVAAAWAQLAFGGSQDPLAGARVFGSKGCSKCHSVGGVGGKVGPDLARVLQPRSFFDLATAMWNHLPQMVQRMKGLGITRPVLNEREAGDLAGFLYTLNYFDPSGDGEAGRRLFAEKRCIVCHTVRGTGGVVGPSLDYLAQFGSAIFVATAMWNHGPQMAAVMEARGVVRPAFTGAELRDLIAYLAPATAGPQEGPIYALPGRPEAGRLLFAQKRCIECHAVGGVGAKIGPDLVERGLRQSPIEFAATIWNKAPAMAVVMRSRGISVPQLRPEEMADIVAYLYAVRYFAGGEVQKGWTVATSKGCLACHGVRGERGKPASDITRAKGVGSPAGVLAALWNHAVVTPRDPSGQVTAWPEFRPDEMADLVALLQSFGRKSSGPERRGQPR